VTNRTSRELLATAQNQLAAAGVQSARVDAELLMAHTLGVRRGQLVAHSDISPAQETEFEAILSRRVNREPLQHIIGQAWFRHLTLAVGPGAFVPRPETETLVELALREIAQRRSDSPQRSMRVVDLCTGSAAIPLALAIEAGSIEVYGVEVSPDALNWANRNAISHDGAVRAAGSSLTLVEADATTASAVLPALHWSVDVLTCNPPYIPDGSIPRDREVRDFDPHIALFGGDDGLDMVRAVIDQAAQFLVSDGYLLIEHGDEQGVTGGESGVPWLLQSSGDFTQVRDHLDLAGRPRVTAARRA
jgi:release factor glutamine methyltransferase